MLNTGQRWCLVCGKGFYDVFKLAQHLKDKHNGINGESSRVPVERERGGSIPLGIFIREGGSDCTYGNTEKRTGAAKGKRWAAREGQGPHGSNPHAVRQQSVETQRRGSNKSSVNQNDQTGIVQKKKKRLSSLKKAYVRTRTRQLKVQWEAIVTELQQETESIGEYKSNIEEEMKNIKENMDGVHVSWSRLQVVQKQYAIVHSSHKELAAMLSLAEKKLLQLTKPKEGKNKQKIDAIAAPQEEPDKKDVCCDDERPVYMSEVSVTSCTENSSSQLDGGTKESLSVPCSPSPSQHSEGFNDSDSDASFDSDGSFELQWGDTLQAWAKNMGNVTKVNSEVQVKPSLTKPQGSEKAKYEEVRKPEDIKLGIRVISRHRDCHLDKGEEEEVNDSENLENATLDGLLVSAIAAPDFVPTRFSNDRRKCDVCKVELVSINDWKEHLKTEFHLKKVNNLAESEVQRRKPSAQGSSKLASNGGLKPEPKRYTGAGSNVEQYVDYEINENLNKAVQDLLCKLVSWQERTRQFDPVNAKRKRRLVSGIRESLKLTKLNKIVALVIAPNVQPIVQDEKVFYPIQELIDAGKQHGVPIVFALSRKRMGSLLGQRKNVSVFGLIDVNGAETELKHVVEMATKYRHQQTCI